MQIITGNSVVNKLACSASQLAEIARSLRSCISVLATPLALSILVFSGQAHAALQINNATLSVASPAQGPATAVYITGGGTITANVNVSTIGFTNWSSTSWQIGAGPATCDNTTNFNGNNATTTLSFPITAPAAAGTYDATFIAYGNNGCSANASNALVLTASVIVDNTPPTISSITLASPNPSSAASVSWTVTFSESVAGPTASNFALAQGGGLSGTAITSVAGSGTTWTVTASTGSGSGTLGLNLSSATGITDVAGNPLSGVPVTGPVYTVNGSTTVTVTRNPTGCFNDNSNGSTQTWSGLGNAGTLDGIVASVTMATRNFSEYLKCTGYGFTIPPGATITGITVDYWISADSSRFVFGRSAQLSKANVIQGNNLSSGTAIPTAISQITYGGTPSLWGGTWTPTDINDPGFGAAFAANNNSNRRTHIANVDYMPITITYSIAAGPDHLEIQSAAGGLTCAANPLTIVACQDVACTTLYTGGVTGTLSASVAVNWDGTSGGAAGAGFVIPAGSSSVIKNVQVASAGSVLFGVSSATPLPANPTACNFGATACTFTANTAGFIVSDTSSPGNVYTIPPEVSGIPTATLYLRAVQASTTNPAVCTPAIIGQTTSVNMGYTCNNPAACQAGNLATINATAIAPGGTSVSLAFDANGSAPITARYDDAGRITLNANTTVTPFAGATPVTLNGSSNAYVVAPHHFGIAGMPAGPFRAGSNFAPAAAPYTTVTAYSGLATPTVTKNFGLETIPETVTLSFSKCQPNGTNSSNGTFSGSVGSFSGGVANATNLNWSEVGNGDLVATLASGSYLGSGLTVTGNTGTAGTVCNGGGAGNVGRFIPDHFDTVVTPGMPCPSGLTCPTLFAANDQGFVYSGQPFTTNVYARNALGGTTVNYDGTANTSPNFAKPVTLTAWDALGSTTTNNPPNASGSLLGNGAIAATAFSQGTTVLGTPAAPIYTFGTTPLAPTDIYLRATDADATSLRTPAGASVEGGVKVVSGKVKISNAYGSELLPLPLTATLQYWNSASWVTSTTDSITQFNTYLSTAGGNIVATIVSGLGSGVSVATPGVVTVAAGVKTFTLNQPGVAGSADISLNAPVYLLGGSNVAGVNPSKAGRATFGVYKGSSEFIYQREDY